MSSAVRNAPLEDVASGGLHHIWPWLGFNSISQVAGELPTFFLAELVFMALGFCMLHSVFRASAKSDVEDRKYSMMAMLAAFVGGSAVELITILHQEVGNFYHSQAVVMLFGWREPLYMLFGCYGWMGWVSLMLAHRARHLGVVRQACLGALLSHFVWGVLDAVGAKYLWWTWHNAEPLYADRHWGVPIASSFWIMAQGGAMVVALSWAQKRNLDPKYGILLGPLASLVLMQVPFIVIYHPLVTFLGFHASVALDAFRAVCAAALIPVVNWYYPRNLDLGLLAQVSAYALFMVAVVFIADPEKSVRISYGQPCSGNCNLRESCFWGGFERGRHICPGNSDVARDSWVICDDNCLVNPLQGDGWAEEHWYRLCGTKQAPGYKWAVALYGLIVVMLAALPLRQSRQPGHPIHFKKVD